MDEQGGYGDTQDFENKRKGIEGLEESDDIRSHLVHKNTSDIRDYKCERRQKQ